MFTKVLISKYKLDYFRKMARDSYPLEIQAYMIGKVKSMDTIQIEDVIYPKMYNIQTKTGVQWSADDYHILKEKTTRDGLKIIADIHSHPNFDAVMSPIDYESAIKDGLYICAICSVTRRKTKVRFWTPSSALPVEVIYT